MYTCIYTCIHVYTHVYMYRISGIFHALIFSEEAIHCENKNCEIKKYADKKICGIVKY